jgi:uncharacterized protein (DUF427 family)
MSTHLRGLLMGSLDQTRHEPIAKRIRATMGDATVVDTTAALLVWEPKRVVPSYAIPDADIAGEIAAGPSAAATSVCDADVPQLLGRPVLAFEDFDAWYEEDERNVSHPRDPFHRIDFVHSSRHVRVERDGQVLAESSRPVLVFEPPLPVRYYLPAEDVRTDLLVPSDRRTRCAYKGEASYLSLPGFDGVAWFYPAPLREAGEIKDRIAFFDEHADITVDGRALERPVTPWSRR